VLIDHHQQPEDFASYQLWDIKASSTAELIHTYIGINGDLDLIDKGMSECIYAGMMTDTGSFRYPSTSKNVHLIIADLMGKGLDHSKVHRLIYDDNTESRLRLLGYFLSEKLVVLPEYHTAYFAISEEELKRFEYKTGDTEGIVNYALSMKGIVFAGIFMKKDGMVKISLRSVGSFSAAEFSRINFSGGGHHNAAGGKSDDTLEETEQRFLTLVKEQKDKLELAYKESLV
jgi:phosphoesterase RecJ-like protein